MRGREGTHSLCGRQQRPMVMREGYQKAVTREAAKAALAAAASEVAGFV